MKTFFGMLVFAQLAWATLAVAGVATVGLVVVAGDKKGEKKVEQRVFEMRTYYANPGKMQALHARLRDHTNKLFVKHGMTLIGYWSPIDPKEAERKLVYILAYPSKAAAEKSWKDFRSDEAWKKVQAETEKDGALVKSVESVYLNP